MTVRFLPANLEIIRLTKAIIGLTIEAILPAKAANVEQYINQLLPRVNLALMVQKVGTTAPLIDYHGRQLALPASTQKVITALAALIQLGTEYRFTTTLESHGTIRDNVLEGDFIAHFTGDSSLKR